MHEHFKKFIKSIIPNKEGANEFIDTNAADLHDKIILESLRMVVEDGYKPSEIGKYLADKFGESIVKGFALAYLSIATKE